MRAKALHFLPLLIVLVLFLALVGCFPKPTPDTTAPVVQTPTISLSSSEIDEGQQVTVTVSVSAEDSKSNLKDAVFTLHLQSEGQTYTASETTTKNFPEAKTGTVSHQFTLSILPQGGANQDGSRIYYPGGDGEYELKVSVVVQDVKANKAAAKESSTRQLTVHRAQGRDPVISDTFFPWSDGYVGIPFSGTISASDADGDLSYLDFYMVTDDATVIPRTVVENASGTSSMSIPVNVTKEMLNLGVEEFEKDLRYFILAKDLEGNTTRKDNAVLTAKRMDIALIETIDHVRNPSNPHMVSHYRVIQGQTTTVTQLPLDQRLTVPFGVSKMTALFTDSLVLANDTVKAYVYTTPTEIFQDKEDAWRAEAKVNGDKSLKIDVPNFWRQGDPDESKWLVFTVERNSSIVVRYVWNIQALGDSTTPDINILDSSQDYREGVPFEFTVAATDELLEALTDVKILVSVAQGPWTDIEDVINNDLNGQMDGSQDFLFAVRYHVKVQPLLEETNYASGLVDDGIDYVVSNAVISHSDIKWFDVFHGVIPNMPTDPALKATYWWKTDGLANIIGEDDDDVHWAGQTPDEEPYNGNIPHYAELDHRNLPKWSYVYEFTDLDTTRVQHIRKEAFVEETQFKVWVYPEIVRVNKEDLLSGVPRPEVFDVVDVALGPGTWRDQHVDFQVFFEVADWLWGGNNETGGKSSMTGNFTIDEDEKSPTVVISGTDALESEVTFVHTFKDQDFQYSPQIAYTIPMFFIDDIEVFTGGQIDIRVSDDIALNDFLVYFEDQEPQIPVTPEAPGSPVAPFIGRIDAYSYPLTGYDYVYSPEMEVFRLIHGLEEAGIATLTTLTDFEADFSWRALRILGSDFEINGNVISPVFALDSEYEYYVNFTNDDVVNQEELDAHQNSFGRLDDVLINGAVDPEFEEHAGEYSTVHDEPGGDYADFTFNAPDIEGDYYIWIVARDRSTQDTKLFDYPFDNRHDYFNDTYFGEYETYATKNRQQEIFGTLLGDGNRNFDKLYFDDSMSEDDADMIILLRLRVKPHSWDIIRMDIHEPDLTSYPVEDSDGNEIWYMHTYHPYLLPKEFDDSDSKVPVYRLPRDIYPVYKAREFQEWLDFNQGDTIGGPLSLDAEWNAWKVTDWILGRPTQSTKGIIEGVPVVGGPNPTDFRVRTHEDITSVSMYLIPGEYWNTQDVERDHQNLNQDPTVVASVTMNADLNDPSDIKKWGFWEWTLDWEALGLMEIEEYYTIVVRGYHKAESVGNQTFYEQFQWPIMVDTLGPRIHLYNILDPYLMAAFNISHLDTLDEVKRNQTVPYRVTDWVSLLLEDEGGIFFEEGIGFPEGHDEWTPLPDIFYPWRTDSEPAVDLFDPYKTNDWWAFDTVVYPTIPGAPTSWQYLMQRMRSNDLDVDHHALDIFAIQDSYNKYHFEDLTDFSPARRYPVLLGFPGVGLDVMGLPDLRNSLKYLLGNEDLAYDTKPVVLASRYLNYLNYIYSINLNQKYYYPMGADPEMAPVYTLPTLALFHNIDFHTFIWEDMGENALQLEIFVKDEISNPGEWISRVKNKTDDLALAPGCFVEKSAGPRSRSISQIHMRALDPDVRLKTITLVDPLSGESTSINVNPANDVTLPQNPEQKEIMDSFLSPGFFGSAVPFAPYPVSPRQLRVIVTSESGMEASNLYNLQSAGFWEGYAGLPPERLLSVNPIDFGQGKIVDIREQMKAAGKESLVALLEEDEIFWAQFDGINDFEIRVDVETSDENLDQYDVQYTVFGDPLDPVETAKNIYNGVPGAPYSSGQISIISPNNTDELEDQFSGNAILSGDMNPAVAANFGYVQFMAETTDYDGVPLGGFFNIVTGKFDQTDILKVWYQNPYTMVVSVTAAKIVAGVANAIDIILQSDVIFNSAQDLMDGFVFEVNGYRLQNLGVTQWDPISASFVPVSGQGRNNRFLFDVEAFLPSPERSESRTGPRNVKITLQNLFTTGLGQINMTSWNRILNWEPEVKAVKVDGVLVQEGATHNVNATASLPIDATVWDKNNDDLNVAFYLDGNLYDEFLDVADTSSEVEVSFSWNNPPVGTHSVRIVATDPWGYADEYEFTVVVGTGNVPPTAPVLLFPIDGATNQPNTVVLSWQASVGPGTISYDVYMDQNPSPVTLRSSNQSGTSFDLTPLSLPDATYYWKIVSKNAYGTASSAIWSLTIGGGSIIPPSAPNLVSPANGAQDQSPSGVTLQWQAPATGTPPFTYNVHFGIAPNPPEVVNGVSALGWATGALAENTTYYWFIEAVNAAGTAQSAQWQFDTGETQTNAQIYIQQVDGETALVKATEFFTIVDPVSIVFSAATVPSAALTVNPNLDMVSSSGGSVITFMKTTGSPALFSHFSPGNLTLATITSTQSGNMTLDSFVTDSESLAIGTQKAVVFNVGGGGPEVYLEKVDGSTFLVKATEYFAVTNNPLAMVFTPCSFGSGDLSIQPNTDKVGVTNNVTFFVQTGADTTFSHFSPTNLTIATITSTSAGSATLNSFTANSGNYPIGSPNMVTLP